VAGAIRIATDYLNRLSPSFHTIPSEERFTGHERLFELLTGPVESSPFRFEDQGKSRFFGLCGANPHPCEHGNG
jgi:hypothetical protein